MREILFRGKRTDNGKWECGDLLSPNEFNAIPHIVYIDYLNEYGDIGEISTPVIPETVGQYTGLTDNNGRKIFEGDIVDYISSDVIGNPKTGTIIVEDMTDYDTMIYLNHSDELQIIGNIHDNPELLKGGGNNG